MRPFRPAFFLLFALFASIVHSDGPLDLNICFLDESDLIAGSCVALALQQKSDSYFNVNITKGKKDHIALSDQLTFHVN